MNKTLDVKTIRKELEEQRAILSVRLRVKPGQPEAANIANPDRSALAQNYVSKERQTILNDRLEETLEQVEAALQRLEDGIYGRCRQCGQDISPERLAVIPYAKYCIECQENDS
jgi:RNA polymerase-binding protein DksA